MLFFFHNFISKAICSECTDFVYNFSEKGKATLTKLFHILKMKAHFEKEPHFESESTFQNKLDK